MYLTKSEMSPKAIIVFIFTVVVISPTVHGSPTITEQDYSQMYYTKLISEEYFTAGRPLVILLPLAEESSTNKEEGYLIEELHKSDLWPILVCNVGYKMDGNTYKEIHPHGSYIILTSVTCRVWEENIGNFMWQMNQLVFRDNTKYSWNPRAKFVVSVVSNCRHFENKFISRAILEHLWFYDVMDAVVLFLKSNEHAGNDLLQNTTESTQSTYLELHTSYPYENSDRCHPVAGTVPVKVFTVRNLSDFRRIEIFRGYFSKNFHGCPIQMFVTLFPLLVYETGHKLYNDSKHQYFSGEEWEVEIARVIGKALNMSTHIVSRTEDRYMEKFKGIPNIIVGTVASLDSTFENFYKYTRSYLSVRIAWYTPCAVKYQRWSRFFNIFSVDMWICFALSLVLAVITVSCISICGHKSHLHQSQSYSNIFSVTTNIISVVLSVSVNTQPRSAPLRLFFFCWVCYSVAISTVFQAYLTTFLIEPGYEEPIKTVEQMLRSDKIFGFDQYFRTLFHETSDPVYSAIIRDAAQCPDEPTCFIWAAVYHNISTVIKDLDIEIYRARENWTDENNRPLLCEMDGGVVRTVDVAIGVSKGSLLFEFIDGVLSHMFEGGIFMHIKERSFDKLKMKVKLDIPAFDDTYSAIKIRHVQMAFYLLIVGYILAVACFVTEIMWYRYWSKGRGL